MKSLSMSWDRTMREQQEVRELLHRALGPSSYNYRLRQP